ncbi:MAG TPA: GerAB/ArcD/ProY family transporter [Symbiobacteriaceae bacterium]|nr:GerAB/ArcD/ProY family transporter [Symbiobacteriaceae bacterium]
MSVTADEPISAGQVTTLLLLSRISLTVVYFGTPLVIKQDVWWQSFFSALMGIGFAWVHVYLWQSYPNQSLLAAAETLLGRAAGRLVALAYALFYLLFVSLNLRLTGEFFLYAFFPRTPLVVVVGVVAVLAAWAARAGVEVMGRAAQVVLPLAVGTVLLVTLLLAHDIKWHRLLPLELLRTGPLPHLQDMIGVAARTVELAWAGLLPLAEGRRGWGLFRAVVRAQIWLGAIWVVMNVAIIGMLGREIQVHQFPFYVAATQVSVADFLERIDALILAIWVFGMVIRSGMVLWAAAVCTARTLGLAAYRPLVLALAALAVTYAVAQARSFGELMSYLKTETLTSLTIIFTLIIPGLLAAGAALRGALGADQARSGAGG